MAKTRPAEEPWSEVLIAGKSYQLHQAGGTLNTLPKGASCGTTPRALPKGADCSKGAVSKKFNR